MKTAMILAAGRGERLRPLTDYYPKALCRILDKPLLAYHLTRLAVAGYQRIIINHAYLGSQIRQFVREMAMSTLQVEFSPEPPGGLETGGGIMHALDLLGTEPFITINADIYCDYDLSQLCLPSKSLAHVILVNPPSYRTHGDYGLSASGTLNNENKTFIFSGITAYHPDFFQHASQGRYSVTPMMREWVTKQRVTGAIYPGTWFDMGTIKQLDLANESLMVHSIQHNNYSHHPI